MYSWENAARGQICTGSLFSVWAELPNTNTPTIHLLKFQIRFFLFYAGYRLKDNVVKQFSAESIANCGLLCLRYVCCKSINYNLIHHNCELLNVSALETAKPSSLVQNQEFIHYDIFRINEVSEILSLIEDLYNT